jgi:ADP-ribosylglycohydrolase
LKGGTTIGTHEAKGQKTTGPPPWRPYHPIAPDRASRFRGALLGGAVGDALGAPVEFMSLEAIRSQFGSGGIRDLYSDCGRPGEITDDTQMSLFTAEGLLRGHVRERLGGSGTLAATVAHAYQRWLITQGVRRRGNPTGMDGWLITHGELFSVRAPGNTCISALTARESLADLGPVRNQSKGCGGVMRVAPIGLHAAARGLSPGQAFTLGRDVSALTHGHPTGQLPGAVLAMLICEVVQGGDLREGLRDAKEVLRRQPAHEETLAAITAAETLASGATPDPEALQRLGQGWVAEEALAVALFCSLRAGNLEEGVIMAANITGDSDSTAAITGNLLGAALGVHEIPDRWLEPLELKRVIIEMADDLATLDAWAITASGQETPAAATERLYWQGRYPGW